LVTAGLLLLVDFHQQERVGKLFGGFFLFGLAFWDKALAGWMLSGLAVAAILSLRRQLFVTIRLFLRRLGIGAAAFCLGSLPLLWANIAHPLATIRENSARDYTDLPGRARLLRNTLEGQALFGFLTDEDVQTPVPHAPPDSLADLSARLADFTGHPRHNLMFYGFLLALALAPLARGPALRGILFALVAMTVAWLQMATTAHAGGSVHHAILLWPLPAMVMAISFASASRRLGRAGIPVLAAAMVLLAGSELLVTNEYYAVMLRNGGSAGWTDAVFTLSDFLKSAQAKKIYCVDWGILDSLRLLNRGTLPLEWGGDLDAVTLAQRLSEEPQHLFLGHTPGQAFFPETSAKIVREAEEMGYHRKLLAVIADSYGRPTFEVFQFSAAPQ
jgi:hypothetical protein